MEKKLSKTQVDVLVILAEGQITYHRQSNELYLEDGDNNSYWMRYKTFQILKMYGYIKQDSQPSLDVFVYRSTRKAQQYIIKHYRDRVKHLLSEA